MCYFWVCGSMCVSMSEHVLPCHILLILFQKLFFWFFVNLTSCISFSHSLPCYYPLPFNLLPKAKFKMSRNYPFSQNTNIYMLGMEWKLWCCCLLNHTVYPLVNTPLLVSVHCIESLICIKASDFGYAVESQLSLGLFLDILLLPCVLVIM